MSNDLILSPSYDVEQYPKLSSVIAKSVGTIVASVKSLNVALNLFQKVYGMVEAYAFSGEQMANFVRQSGLAADNFQALANASKRYGGSAEATAKSLTNLRTGLADIQKGGNGNGLADTLKDFNILPEGIKSTDHFLTVIATRMGELKSETEKMDFGRALGLDDLIKNTKQQVCCLVRDFNSILNSFLIDCLFVKNFYNSISIRI